MPVFNNALAGAAGSGGAAVDEGYLIEKSVRFNGSDSSNIRNDYSDGTGNRNKCTFSFWAKFWGNDYAILSAGPSSSYYFEVKYSSAGKIEVFGDNLDSTATVSRFIDNNAWYHICIAIDKGHSQTSERLIIYVNGIRQALSQATQSSSSGIYWGTGSAQHRIGGRSWASSDQGNYYLAEFHFCENVVPNTATDDAAGSVTGFPNATYITDFVEFDENRVVQPKEYTGSYGTRGVYLKFDDASNLGKDSSGNNRNWNVNNMSSATGVDCDHLVDSPTNYTAQSSANNNSGNYAIMSYNDQEGCNVTNGALEITTGSGKCGRSTFWANSGKWYLEFEMTTYGNPYVGIASNGNLQHYVSENSICVNNTGTIYDSNGGSQSYPGKSVRLNAVGSYMMAYDLDNGKIWWGENGTWYETGGTSADTTTTLAQVEAGNDGQGFSSHPSFGDFWAPQFGSSTNSCTYKINFGQRPWQYPNSVPAGFNSLCTRNLDDPEVKKPFEHFEVSTWTGNGTSNRLISTSNSPDWVWIKQTNALRDNVWVDIVRGTDKGLYSNDPVDEDTFIPPYADIVSGGFEVDTNAGSNNSSREFVGFSWDAGTTTVTNASGGTQTPTGLRANPSCGTSIITYTGTGSNLTLPHGLNAVPAMYMVKNRSNTSGYEWGVYHKNLPTNNAVELNGALGASISNTWWNNTRPDSSVINIGTYGAVNDNGENHVAYVFSEIPGYSHFGSFTTGNDHYLAMGFRPRWVMFKGIASGYNWMVVDTTRSGGNYVNDWIQADTNASQLNDNSVNYFDFFSSGVKIRGTGGYFGSPSIQVIYAAFAEHPFKFARAR